MSISADEIKRVADLAKLAISEADIPMHITNLNKILQMIEQMNQVNTDHIQPMAHPLEIEQPLRADRVTDNNQREHYQRIAPLTECGLYLVPKVIE